MVEDVEIIEIDPMDDQDREMAEDPDDEDGPPELIEIGGSGGPPPGLIQAMMSDMLQGMGGPV